MLWAVDPSTGETAWQVAQEGIGNKRPLLATAGNLLFQGTEEGTVRAYDATTGETVWDFRAGAGFRNSPISYIGPDGRQYIAVISSSGPSTQQVQADAPEHAAGRYARAGSTLYVFALPDFVLEQASSN